MNAAVRRPTIRGRKVAPKSVSTRIAAHLPVHEKNANRIAGYAFGLFVVARNAQDWRFVEVSIV